MRYRTTLEILIAVCAVLSVSGGYLGCYSVVNIASSFDFLGVDWKEGIDSLEVGCELKCMVQGGRAWSRARDGCFCGGQVFSHWFRLPNSRCQAQDGTAAAVYSREQMAGATRSLLGTPQSCQRQLIDVNMLSIDYGHDKVSRSGGTLTIRMDSRGNGARLTYPKKLGKYGILTYDARIDKTVGAVSALYLISTRDNNDRTQDEIDWEFINGHPGEPGSIWTNSFREGQAKKAENFLPARIRSQTRSQFDASAWNTYRLEWTPTSIRWLINGKLLVTRTPSDVRIPAKDMYLYISIWTMTHWPYWAGKLVVPEGTVMQSSFRNIVWDQCSPEQGPSGSVKPSPRPSPSPKQSPKPSPARSPPLKRPSPPPPARQCAVTLRQWDQCGGKSNCPVGGNSCGDFNWTKLQRCCPPKSKCVRSSEWYYQCLPQ